MISRLFQTVFFAFFLTKTAAQITGTVVDEQGQPLPFASVYVQKSTTGTTTNAQGEFRLNLSKGPHLLVFQYVGYKQKTESVNFSGEEVRLKIQMQPNELEIGEVVILSNAEDPAYEMMRQAIAKRAFFRKKSGSFSADAYVKGLYRMLDAPKKLLGREVGDMGGVLDSNRTGIIYLSESVSTIHVRPEPEAQKEIMISSKISGDPNGFSLNRANLVNFSLYDEHINVEREILSPLADRAFNYYRFRFLGRFKDQNGFDIDKIEVVPKRSEDPVFSGTLYLVDEQWNIAGADLILTGAAINQPVLDTLRFKQDFVPAEMPDRWVLFSQLTSFKFGVLGFKIAGFYNSAFSNYDLKPNFPAGFFDREIFKIEKIATERDAAYWEKIRPTPLTAEENRDYVRKDSLHKIWTSKAYLDSVDRKNNRFKASNLIFGYTFRNSYRKFRVSYPSVFRGLQFNTVQGGALNFEPTIRKWEGERAVRFWESDLTLNYGFAEKRFRAAGNFRRRFNSINYATLEFSGGEKIAQFNDSEPIAPLVNSFYTLVLKENYLKIYQKSFGKVQFSRDLSPGVFFLGALEFADRKLLENHSDYAWNKDSAKQFTSNFPVQLQGNEAVLQNQKALFAEVTFHFRFKRKYLTYPDFRINENSPLPEILVRYRKAIPGVFPDGADFDFISGQVRQTGLVWGIGGYSDWSLMGGFFARKKGLKFFDHRHLIGNQTLIAKSGEGFNRFWLAPYYALSTSEPFVKAHFRHHFEGFFLDKIPLLRKLNWKETLGFNAFSTRRFAETPAGKTGENLYWEASFGLENIGWNAFRMLRVDFASGFYGGGFDRFGVVLGFGF